MRFAVIALLGFTVTQAIVLRKEDEEEEDHSKEVFEAREIGTGPLDKKYERVPPEHFTTGADDLFMKSMIKKIIYPNDSWGCVSDDFGLVVSYC